MKPGSSSMHLKLEEEEAASQPQSDRDIKQGTEAKQKKNKEDINRDEIIEKLSQDMQKVTQPSKQGNILQSKRSNNKLRVEILMILVFFALQSATIKLLCDNDEDTKLLQF